MTSKGGRGDGPLITTLQGAGPGMHADRMASIPDPEVPERAKRRRFAASYKLAILEELDGATEPGAKGAILRREGLYTSHICLLYTSDAADERSSVDLGGRRIIKK